jgi:hypothetical protein
MLFSDATCYVLFRLGLLALRHCLQTKVSNSGIRRNINNDAKETEF